MGRKPLSQASEAEAQGSRMTLVISSLNAGGAERVLSILANHWAKRQWRITVLLFVDESYPPYFNLHPQIRVRHLGIYREASSLPMRVYNNFRRLWILRRAIADSHADVVISFMDSTNVLTLLSSFGMRIPVFISDHRDPSVANLTWGWRALRRLTYPRAKAQIVLTERTRICFPSSWQDCIHVIPNPIDILPEAGTTLTREVTGSSKKLIAMGRLCHEKGFDRLLDAFAEIAGRYPDWRLQILGEGSLRSELEAQSRRLNLEGRVQFTGLVKDPETYLRQADLFVLSSRTEGFPMALCEAMACGVPVIAIDCPTGPREIVRDHIDGLLVENGEGHFLAAAMDMLMGDDLLREKFASRASEVVSRFGVDVVLNKWDVLLKKIIAKP